MHAPVDSPLRQGFTAVVTRLRRRHEGVRGAFKRIYAVKSAASPDEFREATR